MKRKIIELLLVCLIITLSGCYYDVESEIYGEVDCSSNTGTYTEVQGIVQSKCIACHNPSLKSGSIDLQGHAQLKAVAESGKLLGAIRHASGFKAMPQGAPQLNVCHIDAIKMWIEQGALNN